MSTLLRGVFLGDTNSDHKIDLVGEVAAAAALGMATKLVQPRAIVFWGQTAENGKSQILDLIRDIIRSHDPGKRAHPGIGRRICREEPDLALDFFVQGARRLIRQNRFSEPPSSLQTEREWLIGTDPVLAWLEEEVVVDATAEIGAGPRRLQYLCHVGG